MYSNKKEFYHSFFPERGDMSAKIIAEEDIDECLKVRVCASQEDFFPDEKLNESGGGFYRILRYDFYRKESICYQCRIDGEEYTLLQNYLDTYDQQIIDYLRQKEGLKFKTLQEYKTVVSK